MIVLPEQLAALYALRKTAQAFALRNAQDLRDGTSVGLIATAPDGRAWLITPQGAALRYEHEAPA